MKEKTKIRQCGTTLANLPENADWTGFTDLPTCTMDSKEVTKARIAKAKKLAAEYEAECDRNGTSMKSQMRLAALKREAN